MVVLHNPFYRHPQLIILLLPKEYNVLVVNIFPDLHLPTSTNIYLIIHLLFVIIIDMLKSLFHYIGVTDVRVRGKSGHFQMGST